MTWTREEDGTLFTKNDEEMVDHIMDEYYHNNLEVGEAFTEWVNEVYTPWEAPESTHEAALELWAQHLVHDRPDLIPGLLPWAHCEEEEE